MSENCGELIISAEDLARIQIACQWSSILALLLFYNLDAQSAAGLSLSPVGAGLSLLPLSLFLDHGVVKSPKKLLTAFQAERTLCDHGRLRSG